MNDLKYYYLYDEFNELVSYENAVSGNKYRLDKDEPLIYTFVNSYQREDGTEVRGHFKLPSVNPMFFGGQLTVGGESPEHKNAKRKIAYERKYYDTIFKKWIEFDKVEVEKQVEGNKRPDVLCYIGGELVCIIEIFYTNEKTQEDIEKLKLNNVPVIEINIKNENTCRHLILPALLEANRTKDEVLSWEESNLRREYKEVKEEERTIKDNYERELRELQEQSEQISDGAAEKIRRIEEAISEHPKRTRRTNEDIDGLKKSIKANRIAINKIQEFKTGNAKDVNIVDQIESVRKNIAWQNNRSRQADTIIKRGF
jgi:flagellar biosynthesis GTPase FlhF